jgi:hypothetical protein
MTDISRCLRDGFSTAGTAGVGMGAIGRMSDGFDIHSLPGIGTVSFARIWRVKPTVQPAELASPTGLVASAQRGETVSGDTSAAVQIATRSLALVADGLGHGPQAAEASLVALDTFEANLSLSPAEIMHRMHAALRRTRGAAVAIADIDWLRREVRFCGVGNISACLLSGDKPLNLLSHNGTVGITAPKVQELIYPIYDGALLVMNSDGIRTQWNLDRYPGILSRDAALIAAIVYRDNRRDRDDATVLVLRNTQKEGQ